MYQARLIKRGFKNMRSRQDVEEDEEDEEEFDDEEELEDS